MMPAMQYVFPTPVARSRTPSNSLVVSRLSR